MTNRTKCLWGCALVGAAIGLWLFSIHVATVEIQPMTSAATAAIFLAAFADPIVAIPLIVGLVFLVRMKPNPVQFGCSMVTRGATRARRWRPRHLIVPAVRWWQGILDDARRR